MGPLQAGRGSSSSEELASDWPSSTSSSFKDSLLSQLSSPSAGSEVSTSPVAGTNSLSLVTERVEGLVGEVTGLEAVEVRTGEEMTKERRLLLWKEGHSDSEGSQDGCRLDDHDNYHPRRRERSKVERKGHHCRLCTLKMK